MVKAVIFDFGGVVTSSPFEAFNRMEEAKGLPKDFVRSVNSTNPESNAWAKFERSEITPAEFHDLFAEEAKAKGGDVTGSEVMACLSGDLRPDMVAALKAIKAQDGVKLGCITNNVATGEGPGMAGNAERAAEFAAVMDLFDHVIESSKAGIRKPDPKIYLMACEALDVEPKDCIYLDDLGINCKPAHQLGMQAIKVLNKDQALDDLQALLPFAVK